MVTRNFIQNLTMQSCKYVYTITNTNEIADHLNQMLYSNFHFALLTHFEQVLCLTRQRQNTLLSGNNFAKNGQFDTSSILMD